MEAFELWFRWKRIYRRVPKGWRYLERPVSITLCFIEETFTYLRRCHNRHEKRRRNGNSLYAVLYTVGNGTTHVPKPYKIDPVEAVPCTHRRPANVDDSTIIFLFALDPFWAYLATNGDIKCLDCHSGRWLFPMSSLGNSSLSGSTTTNRSTVDGWSIYGW